MIRINLLTAERRAEKAPGRALLAGQKITVAGSLLLLACGLLLGWRYWALTQTDASVHREIESARREEARLTEILKQVQDFEARRAQLQQRVALIDELRRGQTAPVHIIDQVSRALPEMMWLTSVKQVGYDVTIEGRCLSLTSLSDFVGNLSSSRYFRRPVEIINSEVQASAREGEPETINFTVKGTFQMSGIDVPPADPPGRKGALPRKGGKRG
ncbi:MAG: PilN domain-containing protein [Vicinamibacterales bacterium]